MPRTCRDQQRILARSAVDATSFTCDVPWACVSIATPGSRWPTLSDVHRAGLLQIAFEDTRSLVWGSLREHFQERHAPRHSRFHSTVLAGCRAVARALRSGHESLARRRSSPLADLPGSRGGIPAASSLRTQPARPPHAARSRASGDWAAAKKARTIVSSEGRFRNWTANTLFVATVCSITLKCELHFNPRANRARIDDAL